MDKKELKDKKTVEIEAPKKIKSVRCLELKNQIKNKQNL